MSVASAVESGRSWAESLMTDTLTAYSPGGITTDADGMEVAGFSPEGDTSGRLHAGSRIQSVAATTVTIGGVARPVIDGGLRIPISAPKPEIGWEYVVTATGPASDPTILGTRWHVVGVQADSYATARRLNVVEVTP